MEQHVLQALKPSFNAVWCLETMAKIISLVTGRLLEEEFLSDEQPFPTST